MRYAGLDVSKTCTGWGLLTPDEKLSGTFRCPVRRPFMLKEGRLDAAYAGNVAHWYAQVLDAWLVKHKPDIAGIEQPQPGNIQRVQTDVTFDTLFHGQAITKRKVGGTNFETTHFLVGLAFQTALICRKRGIEPVYVSSNTWRGGLEIGRPPTGVKPQERSSWYKGEAKKIAQDAGHSPKSADAAEGFCIALYLHKINQPRDDLFAHAS